MKIVIDQKKTAFEDQKKVGFKDWHGIALGTALLGIVGVFTVIVALTVSSIGERPDKKRPQQAADTQDVRPVSSRPIPEIAVAEEKPNPAANSEQTRATESEKTEITKPEQVAETKPEQVAEAKPEQVAEAKPELVEQPVRSDLVQLAAYSLQAAIWHPLHFKPAIDTATNEQCLACHQEILTRKVRKMSPAGFKADQALAWYQTLDTYTGEQQTFHARHLTSAFAQKMMNLKCTFCHRGSDPREEAQRSSTNAQNESAFTLRKMVSPSKICLMCHGRFPHEVMEGVDGPWHKVRQDLEDEETPNACLTCHAETFRTVRHQVNYLKPEAIEKLAKEGSSDVCIGCHGGRAWYRISYPYPRHPWPGMEDVVEGTPDWAKGRATESDPRYRLKNK